MRRCALAGRFDNVQLHDYDMKTDDAVQLHRLLDALCVLDHSKMLPVSKDERFVFVTIVPEAYWRGPRHDVSSEMCTDPDFVRLCMLPADEREQSMLDKIKLKYEIEKFGMKHVNDTAIHEIPRGSRFAVANSQAEGCDSQELDLFFPRDDLLSA
jgi:hypothetical protein